MDPSLLHSAHYVGWNSWQLDPSLVVGAGAVGLAYAAVLEARPRGTRLEYLRLLSFFAGATVMFLALTSPLDAAAHRLLSMHMLQHVVLSTIGPPLVLLGLPPDGLRRLAGSRPLAAALRRLTSPVVAAPLFIVNMWFWHLPLVYEAALTEQAAHITMHLAFMATGLLFWWPVVQPLAELQRLSGGARLLYLFVSGFPMAVLALLLLASASPIYGYYEDAPRLWGLSAIEDQQIAGLVMGVLGEMASFVAFSILFARYLSREEAGRDEAPARLPSDAV